MLTMCWLTLRAWCLCHSGSAGAHYVVCLRACIFERAVCPAFTGLSSNLAG
jgi:hypothetical protein